MMCMTYQDNRRSTLPNGLQYLFISSFALAVLRVNDKNYFVFASPRMIAFAYMSG